MEELKLRGYVTPEDCTGSDAEKLQKALDLAVELDIRKVIVEKSYTLDKTVLIPAWIEIIFAAGASLTAENGVLFANAVSADPAKASWSFEDKKIFLKGEAGSLLKGDMNFFHAGRLVMEGLNVEGAVRFEFSREIRMENNTITAANAPALTLKRGCNNYIVQYNQFAGKEYGVVIDTALADGPYVIGKDADCHELIIRENEISAEKAMFIGATADNGLYNVQIDHVKADGKGLTIGHAGETLAKERYFNMTATDFTVKEDALVLNNEVKHCYFGD